jgi:hypothetical protein
LENNQDPLDNILKPVLRKVEGLFTVDNGISILRLLGVDLEISSDSDIKETTFEMFSDTTCSETPGTLGYSVSSGEEVFHSEFDATTHTVAVGASGFGKTTLAKNFMEMDLNNGVPFVFKDPKTSLENIMDFRFLAKKFNRNCHIIAEGPERTTVFDIFHNLNPTQVTILIIRSINWSNEYYQGESTKALNNVARSLKESDAVLSFKNLHLGLSHMYPDNGDIGSLTTFLEVLIHSELGKLFAVTEKNRGVNLNSIRENGECCYFGLSVMGYGSISKKVGRILTGVFLQHCHAISLSGFLGKDPLKFPLSIHEDEHGSTVIYDSVELLNKARSSGVQIYSYTQSLADYDQLSETVKKQIVENSLNIFIQKQACPDEVRYLADLINTIDDEKYTKVIKDEVVQDIGSVRESKKYVVHPCLIPKLRKGQAIWVSHNPKRVEILNIRQVHGAPNIWAESIKEEKYLSPLRKSEPKKVDIRAEFDKETTKAGAKSEPNKKEVDPYSFGENL